MTRVPQAGSVRLEASATPPSLFVSGDWTLPHYTALAREVAELRAGLDAETQVLLDGLGALDTAGAALLAELLGAERLLSLASSAPGLAAARRALLQTVGSALTEDGTPEKPQQRSGLLEWLAQIGRALEVLWRLLSALLAFIGLTLETLARSLLRPRSWRVTALVAQIEQSGLNAVPIVVLLTFLVGAVVAFLGATVLARFGASVYTVDLVAFAFLREFGVLLTAILMAGRTASAFTAQIGSMKVNEEIDAIRTLGLNPIELLVLPRVLALLVTLPLLTFLAMLAGIIGGAVVCVLTLDISPAMFMAILQRDIEVRHFLVGLAKAPVFAFLIALIGCLEGFKVSGSAKSVGDHTTSSVVQSIFVVILLDAVAALFFMEMGW
ncbi:MULTISPECIES: ABC transporter permease [unclassified Pseudomonas]|uniref:MlaE family ABC transporter permease n=1 Tax=unclassified Pseudomonas TaxID=196821 RepID=UPI0010F58A3E|nr:MULTISPECIES: ABC transporter permease [unclassified Pseudomonas]